MLEGLLESLDLERQEIDIYCELLESGATTAGVLARKLGVARPTLYGILQRMHDKGVVARSLRHGVRSFMAETPQKLSQLFRKRIERLQNQHKQFVGYLPELEKKFGAQMVKPKFQLYEGVEGVQNILKDMLTYYDTDTFAFWPIKSMIGILSPDFFRYHNKERIRNNLYTRAIWPAQEVVSVKYHPYLGWGKEFKREIRIAPMEIQFTMGYWAYKNKVAFLSSKAESFGFVIESVELVTMLKAQFDVLWAISSPLPFDKKDVEGFITDIAKQNFE
jgi:predicted transcriptional regulator